MRATMYLHSNKESNRDMGEQLGLVGPALEQFAYALYEVEFEIEVDPRDGSVKILKVDGSTLAKPEKKYDVL